VEKSENLMETLQVGLVGRRINKRLRLSSSDSTPDGFLMSDIGFGVINSGGVALGSCWVDTI
jgi:hypothetical protein